MKELKTVDELCEEWGNLSGGTPEQHIYDYLKGHIESLQSQLKEKDKEINLLNKMIDILSEGVKELDESETQLNVDLFEANCESDELREALRETVDRLDRSSKTHYYCAAILQSVGLTEGDEPLSMAQNEIAKTLGKCRKLIE